MKGLRSWRRTAVRLRLFDALLFFRTVLFDIAAENPPDNLFGLTQNATFGKEIHRQHEARNRKYLTGAAAECLHCRKASAASCGR